jgi:hypothetical protein
MKQICYRIKSGWPENPWWFCPVEFLGEQQRHIHTTIDVGQSPTPMDGPCCGLYFEARSQQWPIEARRGQLLIGNCSMSVRSMTSDQKASVSWTPVSIENAIAFLRR